MNIYKIYIHIYAKQITAAFFRKSKVYKHIKKIYNNDTLYYLKIDR